MRALSESEIRNSFENCSHGEAQRLHLPAHWDRSDWQSMAFLGWIDPKSPHRGYVVVDSPSGARGIVLHRVQHRGRPTAQMCQFCLTLHGGTGVSMYSAARPATKKERYSSLGTYLCSDLGCSEYTVGSKRPEGIRQMEETMTIEDRKERTTDNVRRFIQRLSDRRGR
ncbi:MULTISPECIES: FBP domain-containing protein [Micrococcales]|uniref:FBP domain-containing protein n=1 Tax=Micrococcales TaxID=85006 RepID=UPI0004ABA78A|nr:MULTISPECIES: FBP domain-containing protein [Micrococcales]